MHVARVFNNLVFFGSVGFVREREVMSEEIIKNCKIMNILLNRCVELIDSCGCFVKMSV